MITLFRRMREKLIQSGSFSKYLLYALGEVLLVVIGILIALQINNWNEFRVERAIERDLLIQLQSEYESNLEQLDEKIQIRNNLLNAAIKLLSYIDDPVIRNKDSTYVYIGQTLLAPTFDPIINDIISSGRIQLIQNADLRSILTRWTSDIIQVTEEENVWVKYSEDVYFPTIRANIPIRTIVNSNWKTDLFNIFQLDKDMGVSLYVGESKYKSDFNQLLDDPTFENNMARAISTMKITNSQSLSLRQRIIDILNLIEKEINQDNS